MPSDDPTKRYRRFAAMIVVTESADNFALCRRCAKELQVLCKRCQLGEVADTVARFRPFVVLTDEATSDDDLAELHKVGQVVGAQLIVLTNAITADIEGSLLPALRAARERLQA